MVGGWSSIEIVQQFYLKSSDANETKAVGVLEELMELMEEKKGLVFLLDKTDALE